MKRKQNPTLVNAEAEGLAVGDFAFSELKVGDEVKVWATDGTNRVGIWIKVASISRHPHPDYNLLTGTVDDVMGSAGLDPGQEIQFARCNIAEIA